MASLLTRRLQPLLLHKRYANACFECKSFSSDAAQCKPKDNFVKKSPLADIDSVFDRPLQTFIWENLGSFESLPAFTCGATGKSFTHKQVYELSRSFATSLVHSRGLNRGDVIGIMLPNIPEFPVAVMGILSARMVFSPINPAFTEGEVLCQLVDCKATAVVTISPFVPLLMKVKSQSPYLKLIIVADDNIPDGTHSLSAMMKTAADPHTLVTNLGFDGRKTVACIPYSSGTTGPPKGVMLSHSNLATNMVQQSHPAITPVRCFTQDSEQERLMGLLPFHHIYGLNVISTIALYRGSHCVTLPKFDPRLFLHALESHKPTVLHMVPPLISLMANSRFVGDEIMKSIRIVIAGGAPLGETLISKFLHKAGKFVGFQEGYGMTELSPVSHLTPPSSENSKIGSVGQPVPSTMSKIVDLDTGKSVGEHSVGELCVKGPQVMLGYFENDDATQEMFYPDGWLRTGDVGYYDSEGYFYIVDRIKELIKVKSSQVSPSELEDVLRKMDGISDCAVIGVPSKSSGELPRAYIVKDDPDLTADLVHDYMKSAVSSHKHLHGGIEFVKAIPKAPSGKILRRELKMAYLQGQHPT